jgi:hypothetical protein
MQFPFALNLNTFESMLGQSFSGLASENRSQNKLVVHTCVRVWNKKQKFRQVAKCQDGTGQLWGLGSPWPAGLDFR